jgi:hypothetical protein
VCHGIDFDNRFSLVACRCGAVMAVQPQLGLRTQRDTGIGSDYCVDSGIAGADLNNSRSTLGNSAPAALLRFGRRHMSSKRGLLAGFVEFR